MQCINQAVRSDSLAGSECRSGGSAQESR